MKLHQMHPDYHIVAAAYDMPANLPKSSRNFQVIPVSVDATQLHTGKYSKYLKGQQFDAIIYNNPHAYKQTQFLVEEFVESAQPLLAPGGQINIHLTNSARTKYNVFDNIADARLVGRFGPNPKLGETLADFPYYAPYVPLQTCGATFKFYGKQASRSRYLERWVIPRR